MGAKLTRSPKVCRFLIVPLALLIGSFVVGAGVADTTADAQQPTCSEGTLEGSLCVIEGPVPTRSASECPVNGTVLFDAGECYTIVAGSTTNSCQTPFINAGFDCRISNPFLGTPEVGDFNCDVTGGSPAFFAQGSDTFISACVTAGVAASTCPAGATNNLDGCRKPVEPTPGALNCPETFEVRDLRCVRFVDPNSPPSTLTPTPSSTAETDDDDPSAVTPPNVTINYDFDCIDTTRTRLSESFEVLTEGPTQVILITLNGSPTISRVLAADTPVVFKVRTTSATDRIVLNGPSSTPTCDLAEPTAEATDSETTPTATPATTPSPTVETTTTPTPTSEPTPTPIPAPAGDPTTTPTPKPTPEPTNTPVGLTTEVDPCLDEAPGCESGSLPVGCVASIRATSPERDFDGDGQANDNDPFPCDPGDLGRNVECERRITQVWVDSNENGTRDTNEGLLTSDALEFTTVYNDTSNGGPLDMGAFLVGPDGTTMWSQGHIPGTKQPCDSPEWFDLRVNLPVGYELVSPIAADTVACCDIGVVAPCHRTLWNATCTTKLDTAAGVLAVAALTLGGGTVAFRRTQERRRRLTRWK